MNVLTLKYLMLFLIEISRGNGNVKCIFQRSFRNEFQSIRVEKTIILDSQNCMFLLFLSFYSKIFLKNFRAKSIFAFISESWIKISIQLFKKNLFFYMTSALSYIIMKYSSIFQIELPSYTPFALKKHVEAIS